MFATRNVTLFCFVQKWSLWSKLHYAKDLLFSEAKDLAVYTWLRVHLNTSQNIQPVVLNRHESMKDRSATNQTADNATAAAAAASAPPDSASSQNQPSVMMVSSDASRTERSNSLSHVSRDLDSRASPPPQPDAPEVEVSMSRNSDGSQSSRENRLGSLVSGVSPEDGGGGVSSSSAAAAAALTLSQRNERLRRSQFVQLFTQLRHCDSKVRTSFCSHYPKL